MFRRVPWLAIRSDPDVTTDPRPLVHPSTDSDPAGAGAGRVCPPVAGEAVVLFLSARGAPVGRPGPGGSRLEEGPAGIPGGERRGAGD